MNTDDKRKEVESLIDKAAHAADSGDALRFSQAACNSANAMFTVKNMQATFRDKIPQGQG